MLSGPSTIVASLLRRDHVSGIENADIVDIRLARILFYAFLDLVPEVREQALDRPGCGVAERADGVTLDLSCPPEQHVDFAFGGAALGLSCQPPPHPAGALPARRALAAALVL